MQSMPTASTRWRSLKPCVHVSMCSCVRRVDMLAAAAFSSLKSITHALDSVLEWDSFRVVSVRVVFLFCSVVELRRCVEIAQGYLKADYMAMPERALYRCQP